MEPLRAIKLNTMIVIEQFGPLSGVEDFGLNAESVDYIASYIYDQRSALDEETTEKLIMILGSFVGECVIACHGGRWIETEHGWGVQVNDQLIFYPFAKTAKQFKNDTDGDTVRGIIRLIGALKDADLTIHGE